MEWSKRPVIKKNCEGGEGKGGDKKRGAFLFSNSVKQDEKGKRKDGSRVIKTKTASSFLHLMSKFFSANFWAAL